jgi:hypothetical protein
MAPEQASGRNDLVDPRTDVYGLGSILYEMLSGQAPFVGEVMEVLKRVQEEKPKAPSELAWGRDSASASSRRMLVVPPELEALCLRALSKDPQKRPPTALAFAEELATAFGVGKRSLPKIQGGSTALPTEMQEIAQSLGSKRGKLVPALLIVFFMVLAGTAAIFLQKKFSDAGSPREKAMKLLGEFRPDLINESFEPDVLRRSDFVDILRRRDAISAFKQALIERIKATNPYMPKLSIGPLVARNVTLSGARDEGVTFAPWTKFGPTGIREMASHSDKPDRQPPLLTQAGSKFALALYALSADYAPMARELFSELKGTQYESEASEYLRLMNEAK